MSFYPEHDRKESEGAQYLIVRHKQRREKERLNTATPQEDSREKERLETATPQEAKGYLNGLVQKAFLQEVLATNFLEEGKAGPLNQEDGSVVRAIETSDGWRFVSDEVWKVGMELLAADLGCTLESVGIETRARRGKKGQLRNETKLAVIREGFYFLRIEEFDPDSGERTLLGYEASEVIDLFKK